jgi:hypothetical protein
MSKCSHADANSVWTYSYGKIVRAYAYCPECAEEIKVLTEAIPASAESETYLFNEVQSLRAQLVEAVAIIRKTWLHGCLEDCSELNHEAQAYLEKYEWLA